MSGLLPVQESFELLNVMVLSQLQTLHTLVSVVSPVPPVPDHYLLVYSTSDVTSLVIDLRDRDPGRKSGAVGIEPSQGTTLRTSPTPRPLDKSHSHVPYVGRGSLVVKTHGKINIRLGLGQPRVGFDVFDKFVPRVHRPHPGVLTGLVEKNEE